MYWAKTGKKLNLKNPVFYSEKIQWLKLYEVKENYSQYVDKLEVRSFVKEKIGEDHLIPLIGIYNSVSEIDWKSLPDKFVLKCTHGSGSNIVCEDKSKLNYKDSSRKLKKWVERNYYWYGRSKPYKNIKPRIIAEEYMVDDSGFELKDYKIFCFNGEPKIIQVDYSHFTNNKRNIYDTEWNYLPVSFLYNSDPNVAINKPKNLSKMLDIARTLSNSFVHVRIDLYVVFDKIYFGEMTFFPESGFGEFEPSTFSKEMGNYIKI